MSENEKYPLKILPFNYNGFSVDIKGKKPVSCGRFIRKTSDPGIVEVELSSGEISLVPTCAIIGELPKLEWQSCFKEGTSSTLFGVPSSIPE